MDLKHTLFQAKAGDENAKEKILLHFDKEIFDVASGYQNIAGYGVEDLVQEGKILLTRLIEIYDESKGYFEGLLRTALNNKYIKQGEIKLRWRNDRVELLVQSSDHRLMGMQRSE